MHSWTFIYYFSNLCLKLNFCFISLRNISIDSLSLLAWQHLYSSGCSGQNPWSQIQLFLSHSMWFSIKKSCRLYLKNIFSIPPWLEALLILTRFSEKFPNCSFSVFLAFLKSRKKMCHTTSLFCLKLYYTIIEDSHYLILRLIIKLQ